MRVAITGTPGTGKSTVSRELRSRGWEVLDLAAFLRRGGLLGELDEGRDTREVDVDEAEEAMTEAFGRDLIVEGHLSHLMDPDLIIVLRCHPSPLGERLRDRGYGEAKVVENMEAEALDVILIESMESGAEVTEVDTTHSSAEEVAEAVVEILEGEREKYAPGDLDRSEEVLRWF